MSVVDIWLLVVAAVLVVVAGLFSSADAALSSFSKARAEEMAAEGMPGSARLLVILEDPPRYLNTALFLRMLTETAAIILVTVVSLDVFVPRGGPSPGRRPTAAAGWPSSWRSASCWSSRSWSSACHRARWAASTPSASRCSTPGR